MQITIDRFEENYAVVELENKKMVEIPLEIVPSGAKEGSVLEIIINHEETKKRKEEAEDLMDELWEK